MNIKAAQAAICFILSAAAPFANALEIQGSEFIDIEPSSSIFRDFRGPSSTRIEGDRLVFSIKVSDTSKSEPNTPPTDLGPTSVLVAQIANGDPEDELGPKGFLSEAFGPAIPNEYAGGTTWLDAYADSAWKIEATYPADSTDPARKEIQITPDNTIPGGDHLPLSTDISLDGEGELTWVIPATDVVYNYYRVALIRESDKKIVAFTDRTFVPYDGLMKEAGLNVFDDFGGDIKENEAYELRIETRNLDDTRDISKLINRSSTFANFTLLPPGTGPVNLPTLDVTGVFNFDFEVVAGETYAIDPYVAVGYEYMIGEGDPLFASVMIPNDFTVDGFYELLVGGASIALAAGDVYDFGTDGVSFFTILGIDPALMLDPSDTTAFVTNLTFTDDGRFTGTMTPITEFVPEPASLALLGLGLAGIGYQRRKQIKAA